MKIRSTSKINHAVATVFFACLFCLVLSSLASVTHADGKPTNIRKNLPEFKDSDHKRHRGSNAAVQVLYYGRSSDLGIIKKSNGHYEVRTTNGAGFTWVELEGYPEDLPAPRSHVDYYPEEITNMEN